MSAPSFTADQTSRRSTHRAPAPRRAARRKHSVARPRRSTVLTLLMGLTAVYALMPLAWLVINATKTQKSLLDSFGLWFSGEFALWDNISQTLTYDDGIFVRWFLNTLLYVVVGAGGATFLAVLGGYGLAKFDFAGKRAVFATVIGAVAVPATALAVPTFLMFSKMGLTNTPWAVIIPSLISPFGLYLMWVFAAEAIPTELLEAARVDGSGELRTFFQVALPLLTPGIVTVLLFTMVQTWNNYFLPVIMIKNPDWYPLTLGLNAWNQQASTAGGQPVFNLVITGSLLTIVPLIAAFLLLQRYWQSGLAAGSVKG
ncbi:carbohydrate ABC transporter permease [Streptomyces sp. NPDC053741]|jgi:multiple sugar transport system permease protein|uniref:Binding-protein-dependent transport systems inner membrane component n=1 Tax=Streptomyces pratensis (strain ATCC 33331 / IAF-45CD) TaxID=591167 RepID=A0A8D3WRP1_STRFA|nr:MULTISPECIES: carbohydrate ABC transporter permease [Streptomyces]MBD2830867.1 carbohydrate ABC transporter permease [Streptomyces pratensis]RAS32303.1 carbohydrate ABC transporter membrane protein 2 (CUT1 family) [Streptomyces avidinii]SNX76061.1 carbohydrate ABC transporter membrane protein 2, CUT1 family [Streptomyces microflavus]AGJ53173.1 ABC-type sugar transport system permease component [Streptomyces sp. PAMC 26508]MCX4417745.1 carbohydrate ABC transporter permease [[Kitasatospora] p